MQMKTPSMFEDDTKNYVFHLTHKTGHFLGHKISGKRKQPTILVGKSVSATKLTSNSKTLMQVILMP